ncbi:MAG TPA: hypothetical protein VFC19_18220 [Candidatus Limnocylindrales bacterium]|nr:hypothetical protein [Candidatus Limnocylindrales bacterium]
MTYRELAAVTGWSYAVIGQYIGGKILPPIDRFNVLIQFIGATPVVQAAQDRAFEERPRGGGCLASPRRRRR